MAYVQTDEDNFLKLPAVVRGHSISNLPEIMQAQQELLYSIIIYYDVLKIKMRIVYNATQFHIKSTSLCKSDLFYEQAITIMVLIVHNNGWMFLTIQIARVLQVLKLSCSGSEFFRTIIWVFKCTWKHGHMSARLYTWNNCMTICHIKSTEKKTKKKKNKKKNVLFLIILIYNEFLPYKGVHKPNIAPCNSQNSNQTRITTVNIHQNSWRMIIIRQSTLFSR